MKKFKFPTAFTIRIVLIAIVAALPWIIPAGQYDQVLSESLGRDVPVPGTYKTVDANPQGAGDVLVAPIAGLYDPATGAARAIDVALFVLIVGGFLAVVTKTGAIDAGIGRLMQALDGREIWMIAILMTAFAAGGASYGMAAESLAFYALVIAVMLRAGYDSVTGVATIMLRAGIGTLGSTFNAFATVIASNAAGVRSPTDCCCGSSFWRRVWRRGSRSSCAMPRGSRPIRRGRSWPISRPTTSRIS
ncbi:MAG: putative ion transporter superfamily protein YfcC [Paracoccaceae bacterium]|jgi:uncharacterized ion transporter superfamily protein YfcC